MKKLLIIFQTILFFNTIIAQTPSNDPHWELLWEDNFEYFDDSKWLKVDWAIHGNEPQLYLAQNADTYDGNLAIAVNKNDTTCYSGHAPTVWGACTPCQIDTT